MNIKRELRKNPNINKLDIIQLKYKFQYNCDHTHMILLVLLSNKLQ